MRSLEAAASWLDKIEASHVNVWSLVLSGVLVSGVLYGNVLNGPGKH